jgi:hypothetical protein
VSEAGGLDAHDPTSLPEQRADRGVRAHGIERQASGKLFGDLTIPWAGTAVLPGASILKVKRRTRAEVESERSKKIPP